MKIGFDAKRVFNNATGLGNFSRGLLSNLQHFHPENSYHLFAPEAKKTTLNESIFDPNRFQLHESKSRLKAYWRSFSIVQDLQKTGIQIYHGLSNELPFGLQKTNIKSIVTIHDLIFKIYPETYSFFEHIVYDKKFKYACQNADKVIAISHSTKNDIVRFYDIDSAKIEVVYQSCNPLFYTLRSEAENQAVLESYALPNKYFLYVGSVEKRKNLKLIIETYRLHSNEIQIPLLIVGRGGAYQKECEKLIATYGLQHFFVWQNKLQNNEHLQSIYQSAAALIYPSFYEGFGLPVAEALLSKTPVITANTSSLKEAGGPDSIYIDPNNVQELKEAMMRILTHKNEVNTMVENGYVYAHETFSPQKTTAQMFQIYLSCT